MHFYAIRGAITVEANEKNEILNKTEHLLKEILEQNSLNIKDIVSIIFTCTDDITVIYPAVAARKLGMVDTALFCCQEMKVDNSLRLCVRVLIHVQKESGFTPKHIYLEKATQLRPDLVCHNKRTAIAIDGPAGAGKSTIAKILAKRLNILYLDTGAMYRAMALKILEVGGNPKDPDSVLPHLSDTDIQIEYKDGAQKVFLDGRDVTELIRTQQVSKGASDIGTIPEVRKKLVDLQRAIADKHSVVMDGRDIGTYVLPNADRKFFLTASVEERARRRYEELIEKGGDQEYSKILNEIIERDNADSSRAFAPLRKAEDAILIDSTGKSIDEVIDEISSYI